MLGRAAVASYYPKEMYLRGAWLIQVALWQSQIVSTSSILERSSPKYSNAPAGRYFSWRSARASEEFGPSNSQGIVDAETPKSTLASNETSSAPLSR